MPAGAGGPAALRLQHLCETGNGKHIVLETFALSDSWGRENTLLTSFVARICLESADATDLAQSAPLRDVLLRRAPLPGFGLLPPQWQVPDRELRSAQLACEVAAADGETGARALLALLRAHVAQLDCCFGVVSRFTALAARDSRANVTWSAVQCTAAHEAAIAVLEAHDVPPLQFEVLILLGAVSKQLQLRLCKGAPALQLHFPRLIPLALRAAEAKEPYDLASADCLLWLDAALRVTTAADGAVLDALAASRGIACVARLGVRLFPLHLPAPDAADTDQAWQPLFYKVTPVFSVLLHESRLRNTSATLDAESASLVLQLVLDVLARVEHLRCPVMSECAGLALRSVPLVLSAHLAATQHVQTLSAVLVSPVPRVATRLLRDASAGTGATARRGSLAVWLAIFSLRDLMPGGGLLLKIVRDLDVSGAAAAAMLTFEDDSNGQASEWLDAAQFLARGLDDFFREHATVDSADSLLLRVFVSDAECELEYPLSLTIAGLLAHPDLSDGLMRLKVCLASVPQPAPRVLLRDVLLRRAELPGFGLVPAAWVPEDTRKRVLLRALVVAARDISTVARLVGPDASVEALFWAADRMAMLLEKAPNLQASDSESEAAHRCVLRHSRTVTQGPKHSPSHSNYWACSRNARRRGPAWSRSWCRM